MLGSFEDLTLNKTMEEIIEPYENNKYKLMKD